MGLRDKTDSNQKKLNKEIWNEYVNKFIPSTFSYNTLYTIKVYDKMKVFADDIYKEDEVVRKMQQQKHNYESMDSNALKQKLDFFTNEIKKIGHKMKPEDYICFLNDLWKITYNSVEGNIEYSTDIFDELPKQKKYMNKYIVLDCYEKKIKQELIWLDESGNDVKEYFISNMDCLTNAFIPQLMFYKNEITPKGKLELTINDYKNIDIPQVLKGDAESIGVPFMHSTIEQNDKKNERIIKLWNESNLIIKQPKKLYRYQMKILEESSETIFRYAVKNGFFPRQVLDKAIMYARDNKCMNVLPYLIWMKNTSDIE